MRQFHTALGTDRVQVKVDEFCGTVTALLSPNWEEPMVVGAQGILYYLPEAEELWFLDASLNIQIFENIKVLLT